MRRARDERRDLRAGELRGGDGPRDGRVRGPSLETGPGPAFSKFCENFANFWRARSRLYQNEILQENMRSTAVFKLYKICILLHRCNLKIFAKNRFEKTSNFREISAKKIANVGKFAKFCQISKISA